MHFWQQQTNTNNQQPTTATTTTTTTTRTGPGKTWIFCCDACKENIQIGLTLAIHMLSFPQVMGFFTNSLQIAYDSHV